jgi:hypothetical protein
MALRRQFLVDSDYPAFNSELFRVNSWIVYLDK